MFIVFARTGSARAVVQEFNRSRLRFPVRVRKGPHKGELAWSPLTHSQVQRTLHNPRYAGAFVYGQHREGRTPSGKTTTLTRHEVGRRHHRMIALSSRVGAVSSPIVRLGLLRRGRGRQR